MVDVRCVVPCLLPCGTRGILRSGVVDYVANEEDTMKDFPPPPPFSLSFLERNGMYYHRIEKHLESTDWLARQQTKKKKRKFSFFFLVLNFPASPALPKDTEIYY